MSTTSYTVRNYETNSTPETAMENGNWKGKILLWYPHECLRGVTQLIRSIDLFLITTHGNIKTTSPHPTNSFFQDTWCHIAVPLFLLPLPIESRSASHPIPLHPLTRLQHNPTELNSHVSSIDCSTVYGKTSSNNSAKWPSVCVCVFTMSTSFYISL